LRELKKRGYRVVHVVPASGAVAKIEDKPTPAKTEQTAVASSDEKAPAKTGEVALAHSEQTPAEKSKQGTSVNLDAKSQRNAEGGWHTRLKRRKVTAAAKPDALQSLIQAFWHR
jgi:hypothetical protein